MNSNAKKSLVFIVMFVVVSIIGMLFFLKQWINFEDFGYRYSILISRNMLRLWKPDKEMFHPTTAKQWCVPGKENDWFKIRRYSCDIVVPGYGPHCGFWTVGWKCVSLAIPSEYYENKMFLNRLIAVIRDPCVVFDQFEIADIKGASESSELAYKAYDYYRLAGCDRLRPRRQPLETYLQILDIPKVSRDRMHKFRRTIRTLLIATDGRLRTLEASSKLS